jgi:hypothetical protein
MLEEFNFQFSLGIIKINQSYKKCQVIERE